MDSEGIGQINLGEIFPTSVSFSEILGKMM
jgi:hypothetical protein